MIKFSLQVWLLFELWNKSIAKYSIDKLYLYPIWSIRICFAETEVYLKFDFLLFPLNSPSIYSDPNINRSVNIDVGGNS